MNRSSGDPLSATRLVFGRWRARPIEPGDVGLVFDLLNDPDVVRVRPAPPPADHSAALDWIRRSRSDQGIVWVLEATASGRGAGTIALQGYDPSMGVVEVGYLVCPWARRRGLATAALIAVTDWVFDALPIHRMFLVHDTANAASCKVAIAAGYVSEGILRGAQPGPNGTRIDQELHGVVRSDIEIDRRSTGDGRVAR